MSQSSTRNCLRTCRRVPQRAYTMPSVPAIRPADVPMKILVSSFVRGVTLVLILAADTRFANPRWYQLWRV